MSPAAKRLTVCGLIAVAWGVTGSLIAADQAAQAVPPAGVPELDLLKAAFSGSIGSAAVWLYLWKSQTDQKAILEAQKKTQEEHAKALRLLAHLMRSRPCVLPKDQLVCEMAEGNEFSDLDIEVPQERRRGR